MTKLQAMEQLKKRLLANDVAPKLRESAKQLIMGAGSLDAEIVFIGEAPGKKEDEQGVPFIGAAGKQLNKMLDSVGLRREDIYITNIVKYRPPNNRDPSVEEKRVFLPYLLEQIQIINPKAVATLGRHSMEYFLPDKKIGDVHGKPETITIGDSPFVIIPLYHPAAALYNGSLRATLLEDFQYIPEILNTVSR